MNITDYLNTDLGNVGVVTKFIAGLCLFAAAIVLKIRSQIIRSDYANMIILFCGGIGLALVAEALDAPALIQSSLETFVATLSIAIIYTLLHDKSLR